MKPTIIDKSFQLFPNMDDNVADDINACKRHIYQMGAQEAIDRIHSALKGLGLEKHSIALNVLRIAGIELPKE